MPLSTNHESFAQHIAGGLSAAAAYQKVFPKAKPSSAETAGPALLRKPRIAGRVEELRQKTAAIADEKFNYSQESIIGFLLQVINTPAGQISKDHLLCQDFSDEITEHGARLRIKMPGKMEAAEKLIRMAGWYAPEKLTVGADAELRESISKGLAAIRK